MNVHVFFQSIKPQKKSLLPNIRQIYTSDNFIDLNRLKQYIPS